MSVLVVETTLLKAFKDLVIAQLPARTRAKRNPLNHAAPGKHNGFELLSLATNHIVTDDFGYGHNNNVYNYTLRMKHNDIQYDATISYNYTGGSCEECDAVTYANSGSYQDDWNTVDPKDYMINKINKLKFNTLQMSVLSPSPEIDD